MSAAICSKPSTAKPVSVPASSKLQALLEQKGSPTILLWIISSVDNYWPEFKKATLPEDQQEKTEFSENLARYNISLVQYTRILLQKEIKQ